MPQKPIFGGGTAEAESDGGGLCTSSAEPEPSRNAETPHRTTGRRNGKDVGLGRHSSASRGAAHRRGGGTRTQKHKTPNVR